MRFRRKGSFGISPVRPRAGQRWSALLLFVFSVLLFCYHYDVIPYAIPSPIIDVKDRNTCPQKPPHPPLHINSVLGQQWLARQKYPVTDLAHLPLRSKHNPRKIQHEFRRGDESSVRDARRRHHRDTVKASFERYWKHINRKVGISDKNTHDSGGSQHKLDRLSITLTDSLGPLLIMGMKEEFFRAITMLPKVGNISVEGDNHIFEAIIQQLGGLLSSYDLLGCHDTQLLQRAMILGEALLSAFDTPNRMPRTRWNSQGASVNKEVDLSAQATIGELASFQLQFERMSQLTGDMRYHDAAERVRSVLRSSQMKTRIPGVWPQHIDLWHLGMASSTTFLLDGSSIPLYDALAKVHRLLRTETDIFQYRAMYTKAVDTMIRHLMFRPVTPTNADILVSTTANVYQTGSIVRDHSVHHSSCAAGAMLALGSKIFSNTTHLAYARRLTEGCIWAHSNAPNHLHIMPNTFTMLACADALPVNDSEDCSFDPEVWPKQEAPGFERITDKRMAFRPESIGSMFYMYRITGDPRYQDVAWDMWKGTEALLAEWIDSDPHLKSEGAEETARTDHDDNTHHRILQTLKYFYLIFSEPEFMSLDKWVFSSGGHSFRLIN